MTKLMTEVFVGLIAIGSMLSALACSGADAGTLNDSASVTDQALNGGVCTVGRTVGGPGACKSSAAWVQAASLECQALGLGLTTISPGPACPGGQTGASYTCCTAQPVGNPPPAPPPDAGVMGNPPPSPPPVGGNPPPSPPPVGGNPPPSPPPTACEWHLVGDGSVCGSEGAWRQVADTTCKGEGLVVGEMEYPNATCDVGGLVAQAKFTCCK